MKILAFLALLFVGCAQNPPDSPTAVRMVGYLKEVRGGIVGNVGLRDYIDSLISAKHDQAWLDKLDTVAVRSIGRQHWDATQMVYRK